MIPKVLDRILEKEISMSKSKIRETLKNTLDPYLYSKNSIMDEVDNFRYE